MTAAPHLGKKGCQVFEHYASQANCYLEYGSGGSTLHAHGLGAKHIISVDSSKEWSQSVRKDLNGATNVDLLYCDIGKVGNWGKPCSDEGIHDYYKYMTSPWQAAQQKQLTVDLVMIDGRFRVACFLYSLLCAPVGTPILFDDYRYRPQYHVVEAFCPKVKEHGRMAEFHATKDFDMPRLVADIAKYSIIKD